jgi:nucleoside-diphosphate-sugar epimerase
MRALIIGCGYLGRRVAAIWRSHGFDVAALTRSTANAEALQQFGLETFIGDVMQPSTLDALPAANVVMYSVGYDRRATHTKRSVYIDGLENVLRHLASRVGRFLYVSSTSVYGQDAGEWVNEESRCAPRTEDGRICLAAEESVRRFFSPTIVLRFSGIYGPGRLLRRMESIRNGEPIEGNPDAFLNLIHVEDGARILVEVATRVRRGTTYLVTDDKPIRRREYYSLLAQKFGGPEPVFVTETNGAGHLNKRCSNARLREELGDVFKYPTIEAGLADYQ